jgi:predicted dehydrogenase
MAVRVRIGVLLAAHLHADGYLAALASMPDVELVGLWDEDASRGAALAAQHHTTFFRSESELLDARPDGVVITSANKEHHRLTELAAQARVNVLCEKPLAVRADDARAMVAACAAAGIVLMTAFPMRFSPILTELAHVIRDGTLGRIVAIEGVNTGKIPDEDRTWFTDPTLAGGGAMTDHIVHLADAYRWLLASEVVEVYAVSNRLLRDRFARVETGGLVSLRFADGVFATIDCSWSKPPSYPTWGGLSMEVVGTAGVISADAFRQRLAVYGPGNGSSASGVTWADWGSDTGTAMLAEFASAIRERREPAVTGVDGLRAVEVVEAAYRSVEAGEPVPVVQSSVS